jgi:hypothetical protein
MTAAPEIPDERWGTFELFRTDGAASAMAVAEAIAGKLRSSFGSLPGLLAARVHVDFGEGVVVCRGQWADPVSGIGDSLAALPLREIVEMPEVLTTMAFRAIPAAARPTRRSA